CPWHLLSDAALRRPLRIVSVDTQPGAGNNPAPPEAEVVGVIDRHTPVPSLATAKVGFIDIRMDVGATSTILTDYLRVADIELSTPLITALFYGIKTN